jgi:hypothetical protein
MTWAYYHKQGNKIVYIWRPYIKILEYYILLHDEKYIFIMFFK